MCAQRNRQKAYRILAEDSVSFGIDLVDEAPDGCEVFRTLTEARKALAQHYRDRASVYRDIARYCARFPLRDITEDGR